LNWLERSLARYLDIGFHAGECTIIVQKKQADAPAIYSNISQGMRAKRLHTRKFVSLQWSIASPCAPKP
jgi:hypothetical protein